MPHYYVSQEFSTPVALSMCSDSVGVILLKEVNNINPISQMGIQATGLSYFLRSYSKSMPH